jgi:hypothetical protein
MDHKPVIDACDRSCALDITLRDITAFATMGGALSSKGECDATD